MVEAVRDVRRSIYPGELIDDWLESTAGAIELTARLLAARGTEAFLDYGRALLPHAAGGPGDLVGGGHEPLAAQA